MFVGDHLEAEAGTQCDDKMPVVSWVPDKGANLVIENASVVNKPSSRGCHVPDTDGGTGKIRSLILFGWLSTSSKFSYLVSDSITTLLKDFPKHLKVKIHICWFNR